MQTIHRCALAVAVFLMITAGVAESGSSPPVEGGILPEIVLAAPNSSEHQEYLGVRGKKTFTIPEVDAEVVIIEIFSMY